MKVLNTVFIILAIIIFGGYYIFFHTSIPFKLIASTVRSERVEIEGVKGSLASGLKLGHLKVNAKNSSSLLLNKLIVDYELTENDEGARLLKVSEISIGELIIIDDEWFKPDKTKKKDRKKTKDNEKSLTDINDKIDIQIDKIIFKKILFKNTLGEILFSLDNFAIDKVNVEKDGYIVENLVFNSNMINFMAQAKIVKGNTMINVDGMFKKHKNNILKSDMPFSMNIKYSNKQYTYTFETFSKGLVVEKNFSNEIVVKLLDTNFRDHLSDRWPISRASIEITQRANTKKLNFSEGNIFTQDNKQYIIEEDNFNVDLNYGATENIYFKAHEINDIDDVKVFIYKYNFLSPSLIEFKN